MAVKSKTPSFAEIIGDPTDNPALDAAITSGATVTSQSADYTVPDDGADYIVIVDTTSTPVTITISGTTQRFIRVIDGGENAGSNIITIAGTIDGGTNATIEADGGSREVRYSGTAWETSGGFENYFTRTASTGVIRPRNPDTLSADRIDAGDSGSVFGGAGVSDFSNPDANTDTNPLGWRAVPALVANNQTSNSSPFAITFTNENNPGGLAYQAFDGINSNSPNIGWSYSNFSAPESVTIDYGSAKTLTHISYGGAYSSTSRCPTAITVLGSNDGTSFSTLLTLTGLTGFLGGTYSPVYDFDTVGSYRYYRFVVESIASGSIMQVTEIRYYEQDAASTSFQQRFLTSGASTTFSPSSLVLKDESDIDLVDGQVTIEYSTNNGVAWSSSLGLDAFKALGNITGTSFWLRYTLVGAATLKSGLIQSAATYATMTSEGFDVIVAGSRTARLKDGGILFGSDTADANKLDDYEEGTWTPALQNIGTGTYSVQVGTYTKIGNLCYCQAHIDIDTLGTASGDIIVTGLPFAANSTTNLNNTGSAFGWDFASDARGLTLTIDPSSTSFSVFYNNGSTSLYSLTHTLLGTGKLFFNISYRV